MTLHTAFTAFLSPKVTLRGVSRAALFASHDQAQVQNKNKDSKENMKLSNEKKEKIVNILTEEHNSVFLLCCASKRDLQ